MAKLKYNEDFPIRAEDFARQGMRDKDIWKSLGIGKNAFYKYQRDFPDFKDALKRGKAPVDVEVENLLLKRARGYEYEEVMVEYKPGKGEEGEENNPIPTVIKKTKKQVLPDTTAQIFWLKNRRPRLWRDKHVLGMDGNVNITIKTAVPRPPEEKENGKD